MGRERWVKAVDHLLRYGSGEPVAGRLLRQRRLQDLTDMLDLARRGPDPAMAMTDPARFTALRNAATKAYLAGLLMFRVPAAVAVESKVSEEVVEEQVGERRIFVVGFLDLAQEAAADDATAPPHQGNPAVIQVEEVRDGRFLSGGTQDVAIVQRIDAQKGELVVSATRQPNTPGVNGSGTLLGIVVRGVAPGNSPLQVLQVNARDSQQRNIPMVSGEATVQVQ